MLGSSDLMRKGKGKSLCLGTSMEKRPCEHTVRKQLFTSQKEGSPQEANLPAPRS